MIHGLLGYIGPETILPLASIVAAIGGALMLTGRSIVKLASRCFSGILLGARRQDVTQREDVT